MRELQLVQKYILFATAFLIPVFFVPLTADFFEFNKTVLLTVVSIVALFLWAVSNSRGDFKLRTTPLDLPIFSFAFVVAISSFMTSGNKLDAFLFPGTATQILMASLFYFLTVQYLKKNASDDTSQVKASGLITALLWGTGAAAVTAILAGSRALSLFSKAANLPDWVSSPVFNTVGGPLVAVTLFVVVLPILIDRVLKKSSGDRIFNMTLLAIIVAGLAASLYYVLPGQSTSPKLLPLSSGWSIMLETLKEKPLFGMGPGNFLEAFNRFRSVSFNSSDVWNIKFGISSNWYLHVWTITGILGIISFLWIIVTALKHIRLSFHGLQYAFLATIVIFLLVPTGLSLLFVFYLILAHLAFSRGRDISLAFSATQVEGEKTTRTNFLSGLIALSALAGILVGGYYLSKVYTADVLYQRGLVKSATNLGEAYKDLAEARKVNPYVDYYRLTFAQASLAIANAIAANKEATDQDKQNIGPLVQQAVREAQAAVAINRSKSDNWTALGLVYQTIIPLAQGADQYALSAYSQAIALDSVNPALRVSLGGIYYSLKNYEDAVKVFELAVAAKPDFANARYNLAIALREKGDIQRAAQELSTALGLIGKDTPGYEQARKELEALEKIVKEKTAAQADQSKEKVTTQAPLQAPPSPAPAKTPLVLPPDAAPPATESAETTVLPTSTPTATP